MDHETVKHLSALRKVNEALIEGLKLALFVFEQEEQLTKQRRQSMIESLKGLISQSEEIYKVEPNSGEAGTKKPGKIKNKMKIG